MALIVQKFGGSSVKDRNRIFNVARIVANTHKAGNDVVVVVSAQGDTTDDLIAKAAEIPTTLRPVRWICCWPPVRRSASRCWPWL